MVLIYQVQDLNNNGDLLVLITNIDKINTGY